MYKDRETVGNQSSLLFLVPSPRYRKLVFEVPAGLFGYSLAHDSWQEIHHMSSNWNKMCQSQKKQKQHSNDTMINQN